VWAFLAQNGGYLLRGEEYCGYILAFAFRPVNPYPYVVSAARIRILCIQVGPLARIGTKVSRHRVYRPAIIDAMSQEPASGNGRMTSEPRAGTQSHGRPAKRHLLTRRDIIGLVLGIPVFVAGFGFAYGVLHGNLYQWFVGAILLFISIGLFIPGRLYEHEKSRAIGFVALCLAIAVSVNFAFLAGFALLAGPHDGSLLTLVAAAICLIASVYVLLCALVLLRRLRPMRNHLVIGAAAGAAAGALNILLMYLLNVLE